MVQGIESSSDPIPVPTGQSYLTALTSVSLSPKLGDTSISTTGCKDYMKRSRTIPGLQQLLMVVFAAADHHL